MYRHRLSAAKGEIRAVGIVEKMVSPPAARFINCGMTSPSALVNLKAARYSAIIGFHGWL